MVGCTPGIPKKVLLRFRDLEKAQLLLAFSDHTLPAQAAIKVCATRPQQPAACCLLLPHARHTAACQPACLQTLA